MSDAVGEALRGLYDTIPDITEADAHSAQLVCAGIIQDESHLDEVLRMLGLKP